MGTFDMTEYTLRRHIGGYVQINSIDRLQEWSFLCGEIIYGTILFTASEPHSVTLGIKLRLAVDKARENRPSHSR